MKYLWYVILCWTLFHAAGKPCQVKIICGSRLGGGLYWRPDSSQPSYRLGYCYRLLLRPCGTSRQCIHDRTIGSAPRFWPIALQLHICYPRRTAVLPTAHYPRAATGRWPLLSLEFCTSRDPTTLLALASRVLLTGPQWLAPATEDLQSSPLRRIHFTTRTRLGYTNVPACNVHQI